MTWKLSGLGAEPKKVGFLALLVLGAVYFLWPTGSRDSATPAATAPAPAVTRGSPTFPAAGANTARRAGPPRSSGGLRSLQEFRPSLKPKDMDRGTVDPTLHLDLLEKLQEVKVAGAGRSLFEFSQGPAPQTLAAVKEPKPIKPKPLFVGPVKPPPPPAPPPPPSAPPIPLKFYGFVNRDRTPGQLKRAFFLDGDDIIVASEGDTIKKRYKIVRIGVNSAVVEDTQFKDNSQQTLPLVAEEAG
jgi:hypothetical protein